MKAIKYSACCAIILLSGYLAYQAAVIALADISHYPVKSAIAKASSTELPSIETLNSLEEKIQLSITLRPNNGEYREYLGRLHYLKAHHNLNAPELFHANITQAYNNHRKASQLRPHWPYSWANMALMKSHLNQFDVGFLHSFNQAEKYGPWEISSNIAISQAGLNGWEHLSDTMQKRTIKALERVYQQQKHKARTILSDYKMAAVICPRVEIAQLKSDRVCKS